MPKKSAATNSAYTIRELTEAEFLPLFNSHKHSVFENVHSYALEDVLSDAELKEIKALSQRTKSAYKLYLGVFDKNNQFVGWSWGTQEASATFYMVNSAILKDHRRKGIFGNDNG